MPGEILPVPLFLPRSEVPNTLQGMSDKGWTDQDFFNWMTQFFVKYIPPTRPVMLLVDGRSLHYGPGTIRAAAEAGIVMFLSSFN